MIRKIISVGQTGAERAAIDVAIRFNISYGGWIPKGGIAGISPLSNKYHLLEMRTNSYQASIKKNILESDGTLIFTRGVPEPEMKYSRMIALQRKKHFLLICLNKTFTYDAASLILSWIRQQNIATLNVSGPKASEDEKMYSAVFRILEMAYVMHQVNRSEPGNQPKQVDTEVSSKAPKTVDEAIDRLATELSLRDKTAIGNLKEEELDALYGNLGVYLWNEFGFGSDNQHLLDSCQNFASDRLLSRDRAVMVIIRQLRNTLRQTHRLRLVK